MPFDSCRTQADYTTYIILEFILLTSLQLRCIVTITISACDVTSELLSCQARALHKVHFNKCIVYRFFLFQFAQNIFPDSFFWRDSNENSENYPVVFAMSVCLSVCQY